MKTIRVKGLRGLQKELGKSLRAKEAAIDKARRKAVNRQRAYLMSHMPVAFGELRASVRVEGFTVVVDAPHAAAVERGSRPHWVPFEALLRWVKLRGFQGLASDSSLSRLPGTTTAGHARSIAAGIRERSEESGYADWGGGASDVGAPAAIARAIQVKIAREGTKPTWFMRDSLPVARGYLREEVRAALKVTG